MINVLLESGHLTVRAKEGDLAPRNESQLAFWGFEVDAENNDFISAQGNENELAIKIINYFKKCELKCEVDSIVQSLIDQQTIEKDVISASLINGKRFKESGVISQHTESFIKFLEESVPRKLRDHQLKAAFHLLSVINGANFSVPGSGKTTVVLSVFEWLRQQDEVDALFVVGPPACFGPWKDEFNSTLGINPSYEVLAGGDIDLRHNKYFVNQSSVKDLYLTTFQTLLRDWEYVRTLFKQQGIKFFFVIDEAHYIKQLDGAWANAALNVASFAKRRCILTGTPFPKSYRDAFNLFDVLWPEYPPISEQGKHYIELQMQKNQLEKAADALRGSVGPLFYRVRKQELGLAPQVFLDPIRIQMNSLEKQIYNQIIDKLSEVSKSDYLRDLELLAKLRRGRMMRLRQCLSYTALLKTAVDDYDETLCETDPSVAGIIGNYDDLEMPAKLEALIVLVTELQEKNEKIVIWSNFVMTLELILEKMTDLGYGARLIYGATPTQEAEVEEEISREGIIRKFVDRNSGIDILVANPAACAESISLHKTCSHAVYYDLSYNCAQYLQSLDRIHRVGGSENKKSYYHFLQYEDTFDQDIHENVKGKAERMSQIIDQEYPIYSLDMFAEDDELEAYERLFSNNG